MKIYTPQVRLSHDREGFVRPERNSDAPCTVLCIDDLAHPLAIRKANLEVKGYSVQTASTGSAALRILEQIPVSAVLLE
jgi:response regulator RpfG family c-di-GMP phosphodiesterase